MASDIEMDEAEAAEWRAGLQVGDLIDGVGYLPRAKWAVAEIIDTTPTHFQLHFVHWGTEYNLDVERTSARIQPSGSRTKGAYTGHPLMERYVAEMATVPLLEAVPLHPHQLQRHEFECSYICDGCQARNDPDKPTSIYNCLMCHFGLCTRCFLGAGGVDPNPPPCERPVPLTRLKTFQTVEFVEDLKEYECAVCLSAAFTPIVLPGCGHLFCWHCISKVKSKSCPTCRGEFSPSSLQVCRFVERQIAAKQAHCRFRASGCVRKGPLGAEGRTLLAHTPTCEYRTFDCQRCGAAVKPVDARKHAERECLIRDPSAQAAAPAAAPAAKSSRSRSCKRKREAPPNQEKEQEGPQVPPQAAVAATAAASSSRQTRSQSRKEQQNLR